MTNLTTPNGTQPSTGCSVYPTAERIGKTFAYCVMIVVSLTGNLLIGTIVIKIKSMRRTINYLLVNMAMSDLILAIFVFPRLLTELYIGYWLIDGTFGLALCKLAYFVQDVSTAVSIQSLVLIAVDRFGAVVFPFRPPVVSAKLCPFYILATWIVAMAIHSPYFFASKLVVSQGHLACQLQWNEAFGKSSSLENYYLAMFLVFALIPFALMTILYSIIIVKLRSQKLPGGESVSAKEQKKRLKRDRSVLKMVLAIVMGFALCWAPFNVLAFLQFFVWDKNQPLTCGLWHFMFFALYMAYANCAINPCICFIFSGNDREGLKSLFACSSCKCNCSFFCPLRRRSWNV
ncbi:RYamide receptor-like [Oculina patagonica]